MAKKSSIDKVKKAYDRGVEDALQGKNANPHTESILGVLLKLSTGAVLFDNDTERRKQEAAYATGNKDGQTLRKKA